MCAVGMQLSFSCIIKISFFYPPYLAQGMYLHPLSAISPVPELISGFCLGLTKYKIKIIYIISFKILQQILYKDPIV